MIDVLVSAAVCFDELFDVGKFLAEMFSIEVEGVFGDFVEDDDDGGVFAKAGDEVEPVFGVLVFEALASVEN